MLRRKQALFLCAWWGWGECATLRHSIWIPLMSDYFNEQEIEQMRHELAELKLEHRTLDEAIHHLQVAAVMEELKIKRLKKRKLQLKDQIARLEDKLIPDILA
jgi:hypothetical protein